MMEKPQLKSFKKSMLLIGHMSRPVLALVSVGLFVACGHSSADRKPSAASFNCDVEAPSSEVVEGGFFEVVVSCPGEVTDEATKVSGQFMGREISFYSIEQNKVGALVGVDVDFKLGDNDFKITVVRNGEQVSHVFVVKVKVGEFPSETLTVQPRKVAPLKKDMPRIIREKNIVGAVYKKSATKKMWDPPMVYPIEDTITSVFGSKRVYNGVKQSAHYGTDIRARIGTPIKTPLSGEVVLAMDLFFTGNTVIVDHGFGFFTVYAHMSKIKVKKGQLIAKGKVLGLSGATGRVSGPHLHWGAQLHGVKIDPMHMMKGLK